MQVISPVGAFPLRVQRARVEDGRIVIETAMGAWRSEVRLDRSDIPLVAGALGSLVVAFAFGRITGRSRA
jgi:hypothetical protein